MALATLNAANAMANIMSKNPGASNIAMINAMANAMANEAHDRAADMFNATMSKLAVAEAADAHATVRRALVSIWVLVGLSAIFLGLRLYCRIVSTGRKLLAVDDILLVIAWCLMTAVTGMRTDVLTLFAASTDQDPRAPSALPSTSLPPNVDLIVHLNAAALQLSFTANILSKSSFVITLLRITTGRATRGFLWFVIGSMNLITLSLIVLLLARCQPIQKQFNPTIPGVCWDLQPLLAYALFAAVYATAMDFVLSLLPWKILWGVQIKNQERIGVCIAMSMGICAGVTGIIKCVYIAIFNANDPSPNSNLFIWENAEVAVTIMATTVPVLRVLVKRTTARYKTSRNMTTRNLHGLDTRHETHISATALKETDDDWEGHSQTGILVADEIELVRH